MLFWYVPLASPSLQIASMGLDHHGKKKWRFRSVEEVVEDLPVLILEKTNRVSVVMCKLVSVDWPHRGDDAHPHLVLHAKRQLVKKDYLIRQVCRNDAEGECTVIRPRHIHRYRHCWLSATGRISQQTTIYKQKNKCFCCDSEGYITRWYSSVVQRWGHNRRVRTRVRISVMACGMRARSSTH